MQLVKILIVTLVSLLATSVNAAQFKLADDAPVYWQQRDALSQYLIKTGECLILSRIGDSPSQYPHQVKQLRDKFKDDKTQQYIPLMVYSCMVTGDTLSVGYLPERYLNKL